MADIKRLAQQTAIYGIPSILGRILGYLLVPLYTRVFLPEAYGVVNVFYSFVSFLKVILTYGMETAFFRFNEHEQDKEKVYSTGMVSLLLPAGSTIPITRTTSSGSPGSLPSMQLPPSRLPNSGRKTRRNVLPPSTWPTSASTLA